MKVAVVNTFNAKDVYNWAGIPYHTSLMLDRVFDGNVRYITLPEFTRNRKSLLLGFYLNKIKRKKYYTWADEQLLESNSKMIKSQLKEKYDLIITFQYYLVPYLKHPDNKVIHWNDATFENLHNYYPGYSDMSEYCIQSAHSLQKRSLALSDAIIYSSDKAIDSAASFYSTDRKKLYKIPFASNLKRSVDKVGLAKAISRRKTEEIKLLFLGADWARKGGPIALEVVSELNKRGLQASLLVVGAQVPSHLRNITNFVEYGFINKSSVEGEDKLANLISESSFLILPTLADMTPVAFSEANAFGLAVITTFTGGIPSVIKQGVNGCCFDYKDFVAKAVEFISMHRPASPAYETLCLSSYEFYNEHLSWKKVEDNFVQLVKNLQVRS